MHFDAAIAMTAKGVLFGEHAHEACADSAVLDRRVVGEIVCCACHEKTHRVGAHVWCFTPQGHRKCAPEYEGE